ncbi:MAG: uracil phosphoribosyltransferase, partial [Acidobacteria bacterium]|nr:uracil phosphoribosyltransferase [Acidobacteriota bacterium]
IEAVSILKKEGVKNIKFMCLIAAPEGVKAFCEAHPEIDVYAAALDDKLNDKAYILPGLGDAGDRLFGTV